MNCSRCNANRPSDATKSEVEGFEGTRTGGQNLYAEKPNTNDMTKQCSMVHRLMEMDVSGPLRSSSHIIEV